MARNAGIRNASRVIEEIRECVSRWPRFADEAGVFPEHRDLIEKNLLYNI